MQAHMKNSFKIIFEDDDVLITDKESGIFVFDSESAAGEKNTLFDMVGKYANKEILLVNSLDKDASGIVLFAKNRNAYDFISAQFKNESVKKVYCILVNGVMEHEQGEICKRLIVDRQNTSIGEKGINSITKYALKEQFKNFAFVEAVPLTTRKNQIRVHFWSIGNSLAIDSVYASDEPILLSNFKKRYKGFGKEKPLLSRLPLHLSKLELLLPGKKNKSVFESQLPKDITVTLKQLRKYNKKS